MHDAETGEEFAEVTEAAILEAMREHQDRVAAYEATKPKPQSHHGVKTVRRGARPIKPVPIDALTGAQRLKRWLGEDALALERRVQESGLSDGIPRSRQSWCARLRELELHPERRDKIKARTPKGHRKAAEVTSA